MISMTLRHFKIFIAVCDTMNMTSAAEGLFMSQSAVSQAIADLEQHYGVRLFERLSKKLYLTQAGKKLQSYARHMIRMNEEAERDMVMLHGHGLIRVGASVTVGAHVLPKLVKRYQELSPNVQIEVVEHNTEKIEHFIRNDQIDVGLVEGETSSAELLQKPFLQDELILVCGCGHPLAGRTFIGSPELEREDYIVREVGSGTRKTFEDVMAANWLSWKAIWTCNNADTIKMAAAEGLGVSVISRRAVETEVADGRLLPIEVKGLRFLRQFKIIIHKNKYLTEPMQQFMDVCMGLNKQEEV